MWFVLLAACEASVSGPISGGDAGATPERDAGPIEGRDAGAVAGDGGSFDAGARDASTDYRGAIPIAESIEWIDHDLFDNTCAIDWNPRTRELFFTVCQVNALWRWRPDVTERFGFDVVRDGDTDSYGDFMYGVAVAPDDSLLVSEANAHRLTRAAAPYEAPVSIADRWPGDSMTGAGRFNTPRHIVVRRDGTIYFTDPTPYEDALELDFNGVFRIDPTGALSLEVSGGFPREGTRPGGVALSPDEAFLYLSTENISGSQGIWRFPIEADGSLGERELLVPGETAGGGARGLCVDAAGNLYHGVYSPEGGLLAFSPEGEHIATLEVPFAADCAFGEDDLRTMFVAAHSGADTHNLYRVRLNIPGAP